MMIIRTAAALVCVAALAAPLPVAAGDHGKGKGKGKGHGSVSQLVDHYIEVYNSHDTSRFLEVHPPGYVNHTGLGSLPMAELQAVMASFYAAFPDLQYQLVDVVTQGNRVVIEYTYTGTHLGDFMGIPATGAVVHGRGLELHIRQGDQFIETFNYSDLFGLFVQLGVINL